MFTLVLLWVDYGDAVKYPKCSRECAGLLEGMSNFGLCRVIAFALAL